MFKYAQILDGKVHHIMEHEANLEDLYEKYFAKTIEFIDITNLSPIPTIGMLYDGSSFSDYIEPEPTLEEINALIHAQIAKLEAKQNRSVREFINGDATAQQRLKELDAQITTLRNNLK